MLNIVGWFREFLAVNFYSLPKSWQYAIVAFLSATAAPITDGLYAWASGNKFDLHDLAREMIACGVAGHLSHRMQAPTVEMPPKP